MRMPTTIRGYLSLMTEIELTSPSTLKGFYNLSKSDQELIELMQTEISNYFNELQAIKKATE